MARRREKLAHAEAFPGRLTELAAAAGKTLAGSVQSGSAPPLLVFADGTWCFAGETPQRGELVDALLAARELLAPHHAEALAELDRCIAAEAEAMRLGRMEKVVAAIYSNLPAIPELRDELRRVLDETELANG